MSCVCACVCVSVCAFDRVCKMPTIHTDTVCCQLYIWPRSTLQETGVIAQPLVKYKYKHVSNATITKTCIHCGQAAATHLFKVPLHLKIFFSHVKEDILIVRSLILILDSYRATWHDWPNSKVCRSLENCESLPLSSFYFLHSVKMVCNENKYWVGWEGILNTSNLRKYMITWSSTFNKMQFVRVTFLFPVISGYLIFINVMLKITCRENVAYWMCCCLLQVTFIFFPPQCWH